MPFLFFIPVILLAQNSKKAEHYDLGIEAFNAEDYETAFLLFDSWVRQHPNDPKGYWYRGQVYEIFEGEGKILALENYNIAMTLDPEMAEVYLSRGRLKLKLQRFDEAEEDFQIYLQLPKGETTQVIYRKSSTDKGFSGMFTAQTENPSQILYHIALSRMGLEDYENAISYLDSAIFYDPDEADYYAERGKALMKLGKEDEAMEALKKAVKIEPEHYLARQWIVLLEDGEDRERLDELTRAISSNPENPQVWKLRGYYRFAQDDWKGALEDLSEAIMLHPEDVESLLYRAKTFAKLKEWEKAEKDFSEALFLDEQDPELILGRGQARYYLNKTDLALADFVQLIAMDPENASAYYHRGITLFRMKRTEEACQDLKKSLELGMGQAKAVIEKICAD